MGKDFAGEEEPHLCVARGQSIRARVHSGPSECLHVNQFPDTPCRHSALLSTAPV